MTTRTLSRLLPLGLVLFACSDQGPEELGLHAQVEANRVIWVAQRPADYGYEIERLCFCGVEARGPVVVTVAGGQVVTRVFTDGSGDVPADFASLFPAADGLFDILADALDREAHEVRVTWDDETGLPVDFWIDYIEFAVDEEVGYRIVALPHAPS
jgi:hypothetical protein